MLQQDEHYNMMFSLNQDSIVPGLCTCRATSHVIAWNVMAEHVTWKTLLKFALFVLCCLGFPSQQKEPDHVH